MRKRTILVALALVVLQCWSVSPASAEEPPSEVSIAVHADFATGGEWSSTGALNDSGSVAQIRQRLGSPLPPSAQWTAHEDLVFTGHAGKFTVRQETLLVDLSAGRTVGTSQWVVLSGTERYLGLHGRGTASIAIDWEAGTIDVAMVGEVH